MNHLAKGDMNELTQVKSLKLERERKRNEGTKFSLIIRKEKKNKPQNKK